MQQEQLGGYVPTDKRAVRSRRGQNTVRQNSGEAERTVHTQHFVRMPMASVSSCPAGLSVTSSPSRQWPSHVNTTPVTVTVTVTPRREGCYSMERGGAPLRSGFSRSSNDAKKMKQEPRMTTRTGNDKEGRHRGMQDTFKGKQSFLGSGATFPSAGGGCP